MPRYKSTGPPEGAKMARQGGKRLTKDLIKKIFDLMPSLDQDTIESLKEAGYDTEIEGMPTMKLLALLKLASNAVSGDIQSFECLMKWGQEEDLRAKHEKERISIERERVKVEREKIKGYSDAIASNTSFLALAELIKNPQPDRSIEELTQQGQGESGGDS